MKRVLIDGEFNNLKDISSGSLEIIEATSNIRNLSKGDLKAYITRDLHNDVLKVITEKKVHQPVNISSQAVIDFATGQNLTKTANSLTGLIVKVNSNNEKTDFLDSFDALVTGIDDINSNIARVIPITYDLNIASEKSIIVKQHPYESLILDPDKKFQPFSLLAEFELPVFLKSLDLSKNYGFFDKFELSKLINCIDLENFNELDLNTYSPGIHFVDYFDIRVQHRNLIENDFIKISKKAQNSIISQREKDQKQMTIDEKLYLYNSFDAVLHLGDNDIVSKSRKVASNYKALERILVNV